MVDSISKIRKTIREAAATSLSTSHHPCNWLMECFWPKKWRKSEFIADSITKIRRIRRDTAATFLSTSQHPCNWLVVCFWPKKRRKSELIVDSITKILKMTHGMLRELHPVGAPLHTIQRRNFVSSSSWNMKNDKKSRVFHVRENW